MGMTNEQYKVHLFDELTDWLDVLEEAKAAGAEKVQKQIAKIEEKMIILGR